MKVRCLAAMMAAILCIGLASAQAYTISTNYNTNLRESGSLTARIVETVVRGTTLQVVGHAGRWLEISRSGSQVWMADWVSHDRVEGSQETASQPASNIDNCCFVDRQCNSDQEWVDGYWAFQNMQCAAPVQSQQQTSVASTSTSTSQIDNCCFVDRQCHNDQEWTDGYWAFQNNQCSVSAGTQSGAPASSLAPIRLSTPNMTEGVKRFLANPSTDPFNNCCYMHHNTCHSEEDWQRGAVQYQNHECVHPAPLWTLPTIVGSETPVGSLRFADLVNAALDLMRNHAPEWLKYLQVSGVRQIQLIPELSAPGFFNQRWLVGLRYWNEQENDPNWTPDFNYIAANAHGITHEACHAIKQRTYTQAVGWANELPCVEAGWVVDKAIKAGS